MIWFSCWSVTMKGLDASNKISNGVINHYQVIIDQTHFQTPLSSLEEKITAIHLYFKDIVMLSYDILVILHCLVRGWSLI